MRVRLPPDLLAVLLTHPERLDAQAIGAGDAAARAGDAAALVCEAERQHVVPLASRALDAIDASAPAAAAMHAAAAAWALRERGEREAVGAFLDAATGVPMLFFKGASTAHTLYAAPWMRMREDWDVLVAPGSDAAARAALAAAGFAADRATKPGRIRMRQQSFRRDVPGSECIVDLHLRALNPPSLADRVPYADLERCSVPLAALHPAARGLADEAALVVACAHRLAHHSGEPRLAWDYDVLLLSRRITAEGAARVAELADRWGARAFVAAELGRVATRFDEASNEDLARLFDSTPGAAHGYLRPNRSRAREFALDWRALGWRARMGLLRETLLPDASFVRATTGSRLPLPLLYAARIARGVVGWFRH